MEGIKFVNILKVNDEIQEKVRQWRNKEEIRKYMISQHIINKKEHSIWLKNLKHKNDCKLWVVFLYNIPIGSVYLQNIDYKNLTSEWGFYIGEEAYKGFGLGAIIEYNLLEYFFLKLNFTTLFGTVLDTNLVVLKMHKKYGFKIIGREKKIIGKKKHTITLISIKKNDWMNLRKDLKVFYHGYKKRYGMGDINERKDPRNYIRFIKRI